MNSAGLGTCGVIFLFKIFAIKNEFLHKKQSKFFITCKIS